MTQPNPIPPGPFRFELGESADTYRISADGSDKPMVEMIYVGGEEDFAAAALGLARLFAAGPRLLAALKALRDEVVSYGLHHPEAQAMFMPEETLKLVEDSISDASDASIVRAV